MWCQLHYKNMFLCMFVFGKTAPFFCLWTNSNSMWHYMCPWSFSFPLRFPPSDPSACLFVITLQQLGISIRPWAVIWIPIGAALEVSLKQLHTQPPCTHLESRYPHIKHCYGAMVALMWWPTLTLWFNTSLADLTHRSTTPSSCACVLLTHPCTHTYPYAIRIHTYKRKQPHTPPHTHTQWHTSTHFKVN